VSRATFSQLEVSARTFKVAEDCVAVGQDRVGHADVPTEVVESAHPVGGIARDEHYPFLPDRGEGPLDAAQFGVHLEERWGGVDNCCLYHQ
jgi:hypothetical protein